MEIVTDTPAGFSADAVLAGLAYAQGRVVLHWVPQCDSSNSLMLEMARAGAPAGTLLFAERQTAGRGRRGRTWHQSAEGLVFSLLWRLPQGCNPTGLSLAVGLAVAESLGEGASLKWPNDVLRDGKKIAGILIESPSAGLHVIGVGVNLGQLTGIPAEVAAAATSVEAMSRETMLADILNRLFAVLDTFNEDGFAALRSRWMARHAFQDKNVAVAERQLAGVCRGVDEEGALLVEAAHGVERILSGDVSVRAQ